VAGAANWDLALHMSPAASAMATAPNRCTSIRRGAYLVRGSSLENSAVDTALILRNELHMRGQSWGKSWSNGSVDPYAFADLGYGRDNYARTGVDLASVV
jgi:hypothetical protein